jgi:hypothetical protein
MSGATAAERLLMTLGISKAEEIDLDAIAWHLGAAVKYRHMDNADATIVGSSKRAIIAINSAIRSNSRKRFSLAHELGIGITTGGRCFFVVPPTLAISRAVPSIPNDKRTRLHPTLFSRAISCVLISTS